MKGNNNQVGQIGRVGRFGRSACCVALVASLCWPGGLALASDGSNSRIGGIAVEAAGDESAQIIPVGAEDDDGADASELPAPAERDASLILEKAREAELEGVEALEKYLSDENLTDEELLSIDVDALKSIDADLAEEIALLQDEARERQDAASEGAAASDDAGEGTVGDRDDDAASGDGAADEDAQSAESEPGAASGEAAPSAVSLNAQDGVAKPSGKPAEPSSKADESGDSQYPKWSYEGDSSLAPRSYTVNLTTAKFIALIGEPARQLAQEHDLYASVMIAQAILESASGGSDLAQPPYFNLFGIKGSYEGQSVTMSTQEDDGEGNYYTIDAAFRSYPSYRESLVDYVDLLSKPYYAPVRRSFAESYTEACDYLQGTYATSTSYSSSIKGLIEAYDLTRYDKPVDYELTKSYKAVVDLESGDVLAWGDKGVEEYADVLARDGQQEVAVEERGLVDLTMQAASNLGHPYLWGGIGPLGYDCSGFVQSSYAAALGVVLPRTTYYQCLQGKDVDFKDLHMGDLLFFTDSKGDANHVAMYLGEDCYIESTSGGVQVTAMEERTPDFAKRVLPTRAARSTARSEVAAKGALSSLVNSAAGYFNSVLLSMRNLSR